MFNPDDKDTIIQIKGSGPGSLTPNRNGSKNDNNPIGSTKANIEEDGDILSSLQRSNISPDRELHPKSE
jgi:hypothetical protein